MWLIFNKRLEYDNADIVVISFGIVIVVVGCYCSGGSLSVAPIYDEKYFVISRVSVLMSLYSSMVAEWVDFRCGPAIVVEGVVLMCSYGDGEKWWYNGDVGFTVFIIVVIGVVYRCYPSLIVLLFFWEEHFAI